MGEPLLYWHKHPEFFHISNDFLVTKNPASPLLRQLAADGGGEDGLAEAFEDVGDGVEADFDGVHLCQQLVEFGGDLFLFGEWRERQRQLNMLI
ncbi:MAG: hypothetical protein R3F47_07930 [Gammaproteobacteria bacterium]